MDVLLMPLDSDENKALALSLALAMYRGEGCKYCPRVFETVDDLKDAVWAGSHERGRLSCSGCWAANNPEVAE